MLPTNQTTRLLPLRLLLLLFKRRHNNNNIVLVFLASVHQRLPPRREKVRYICKYVCKYVTIIHRHPCCCQGRWKLSPTQHLCYYCNFKHLMTSLVFLARFIWDVYWNWERNPCKQFVGTSSTNAWSSSSGSHLYTRLCMHACLPCLPTTPQRRRRRRRVSRQ